MLTPDQLLARLQWRYAAKSFDPNLKIPEEQWDALERALILTPSSYGLQPWQFIVVRDPEVKEKLKAASWNQRQVTECSHYVVFAHRTKVDEAYIDQYLQLIADTRGVDLATLAGFKKGMLGDVVNGPRSKVIQEWAARQCYIALGNFMTSAAIVGVDACPMEGLDPARYDEILDLGDTPFRTVVACAAGYRNSEDKLAGAKKIRFGRDLMIREV